MADYWVIVADYWVVMANYRVVVAIVGWLWLLLGGCGYCWVVVATVG